MVTPTHPTFSYDILGYFMLVLSVPKIGLQLNNATLLLTSCVELFPDIR